MSGRSKRGDNIRNRKRGQSDSFVQKCRRRADKRRYAGREQSFYAYAPRRRKSQKINHIAMNNTENKNTGIIRVDNIRRDFMVGGETVHALRGISFTISQGEFVTIMGTSGSGKSTLLNIIGCLDTPTSGEYYLECRCAG